MITTVVRGGKRPGAGRPKSLGETRTVVVQVRLTGEEEAIIRERAQKAGLPVSAYIRECVFEPVPFACPECGTECTLER